MNLFDKSNNLTPHFNFTRMNEPEIWSFENCKLKVTAPPLSNFFIEEEGPTF